MSHEVQSESFSFQTEVQQILHLMIHSLYSEREIFLRELISNASDACDKLRFESLTDNSLLDDEGELSVEVSFDKKKRTVKVRDNGIGMTRDEVIDNIGTIARSGTRGFLDALTGKKGDDARLIGQFGVGFYSVFMVADKVTLKTRRAGQPADSGVRWESTGSDEYTLAPVELAQRGTEVTLHLRKSEKEFLDDSRLRHIIEKYSEHISLPIRMLKSDEDKDEDKGKDDSDDTDEAWETVNKGSALWARPKKEISAEDYETFYHAIAYDPDPPLAVLHNRVEGKLEYISLLFIPANAPFDLWDREQRHGVKLYVRRIFIMDDARYLMPAYLRFVRGVVDAADVPLNVSREYLQKNKEIDKIRAGSVKKVLGELKKIATKDEEKYAEFWKQFGRVLKEGIVEDADNRVALAELLRFATTKDDAETQDVSLATYVQRMPMKQKAIYYHTADSYRAARTSPHLEVFRKHGIEVLLMSDPIDEWVITHLNEYQDKPLKSVAKGSLDLDDFEDESKTEKDEGENKEFDAFTGKLAAILGDEVKQVRVSRRLTDSPVCLVADEHDLGGNLQRILEAAGQQMPGAKPILEINPGHPIITRASADIQHMEDWAHVLFDQATLSEGAPLQEPARYVERINRLLSGVDAGDSESGEEATTAIEDATEPNSADESS